MRTLSDAFFVDIETGGDWWGFHMPPFVIMLFSTFIPLITDDMNKLSFLTWLPTFAHIANKSNSLENIGYVACSVTPSATYPTEMFRCDIVERCGSRVIFNTRVLVLTLLVLCNLKSTSPCCPVSPPFRCPWHRMSNCIQLGRKMKTWYCWYATWAQKEVGVPQIWEVPMKCCHAGRENEIITSEMLSTIRNEMETRSSRADRTNFGNEDIEWCLFCWHRDGWRLMRIPYASFCMLFSTFIPLITDDMNKLSFLTWLPTFAHIADKSSSWKTLDMWLVRWLLLPPAHWNVSLRYPWTIPEQNWHVLVCHSPLLDHQMWEPRHF